MEVPPVPHRAMSHGPRPATRPPCRRPTPGPMARSFLLKAAYFRQALPLFKVTTKLPATSKWPQISTQLQTMISSGTGNQTSAASGLSSVSSQIKPLGRASAPHEEVEREAAPSGRAGGLLRRRRAPRGSLESQQHRFGYALAALVVLVLIAITAYPLIYNVLELLPQRQLPEPTGRSFAGVSNYKTMFTDNRLKPSLVRTLLFTIVSVAIELVAGLALALLDKPFRGCGIVRGGHLHPMGRADRRLCPVTLVRSCPVRFLYGQRRSLLHLCAQSYHVCPFTVRLAGQTSTSYSRPMGSSAGSASQDGTRVLLDHAPWRRPEAIFSTSAAAGGRLRSHLLSSPLMQRSGPSTWPLDVRRNALTLGLTNIKLHCPTMFPKSVRFTAIWSNPPIRVGKNELHNLLERWMPRLEPDSDAWLVVQRNLGSDSLHRWMQTTFASLT